jgi:glycosyltransferase involved in cell wall biosynthesis
MTVYNGGPYLKSAIDSVLAQSFKDFEFLIVNDASRDNSLATITSFKDPRIKVITNDPNRGQTASLNIGLRAATGEFVARMDADDRAYPQWLEHLFKAIKKQDDCVVISPRAAAMDSHGRFSRVLNSPRTKEDIVLKSLFASPINHVGCLMRRHAVLKMGGYDESYKVAADYDLWSRLLRSGYKLVPHPEVLVSVRFHQSSATALEMGNKVIPEMTRIMKENIAYWKKMDLDQAQMTDFWRLMYTPEILSLEEYRHGLDLLNRIYGPCLFLKNQKRIVWGKRVLGKSRHMVKKVFKR